VASTRHTVMPEGEQADRVRELLWRQAVLSAHGGRVDKLPPGSRPPGQAVHQRGGGGGRGSGGRMSSGEHIRDCTASVTPVGANALLSHGCVAPAVPVRIPQQHITSSSSSMLGHLWLGSHNCPVIMVSPRGAGSRGSRGGSGGKGSWKARFGARPDGAPPPTPAYLQPMAFVSHGTLQVCAPHQCYTTLLLLWFIPVTITSELS
jgi:hypothetical protein